MNLLNNFFIWQLLNRLSYYRSGNYFLQLRSSRAKVLEKTVTDYKRMPDTVSKSMVDMREIATCSSSISRKQTNQSNTKISCSSVLSSVSYSTLPSMTKSLLKVQLLFLVSTITSKMKIFAALLI